VTGLVLADPDERLALTIQLRLLAQRGLVELDLRRPEEYVQGSRAVPSSLSKRPQMTAGLARSALRGPVAVGSRVFKPYARDRDRRHRHDRRGHRHDVRGLDRSSIGSRIGRRSPGGAGRGTLKETLLDTLPLPAENSCR
jgi:hypothetical protein